MNKAELVEALEARLGSNRKVATDAVEGVIDTIVRAVAKGDRVAISGFGTFERVARAARTGRNPRTGDAVRIKKTTVPKFKPGTAFKAYVAAPRSMPSIANSGGVAVTSRGLATSTPPAKKAAVKSTTKSAAAKSTTSKAAASKSAPAKSTATKSAAGKTVTAKAATPKTAKTAKAAPAKVAAAKTATSKKATASAGGAKSGAAKKAAKKSAK